MGTIKPKRNLCKTCKKETWGRECNRCKAKRYLAKSKEKAKLNPKSYPVRNYRKTGDLEFFKQIWNERPHISEISGEPLGEFNICFFSHILPKSTYKLFRFERRNIILKTADQHDKWQFAQHTLTEKPEWKFVFDLKLELTREYYQKFYGKKYG